MCDIDITREISVIPSGCSRPTENTMVPVAKRRGGFIEGRLVKRLTLALMILMLGVASFLLLRPTASERGTQSLVKAFSKRRLIEPRLSGGFKGGVFIEDKITNEKDRKRQ